MIVCDKCKCELKYAWADSGSTTEDWLECPECEQYFKVDPPFSALDDDGYITDRRADFIKEVKK